MGALCSQKLPWLGSLNVYFSERVRLNQGIFPWFKGHRAGMVENSPVMVSWRSNKPPERVRSHTRAFRNPPQPHMCIQDFLEGSQEPCYINVMSWEKIALPLGPDDSIPLYGGMQVPHSPPSHSHVFAVMANPEVLRAKGKHAANPQETQALVLMMLDFVELMNRNRGLHFARHFRILPDRDLAGELKNVWAAVQMKRAHDTASRASLQQLALQQQQQQEEHQRQQQEEQMQRYRRQQQRIQKEKQVMIQKEERYRNQQQQNEELQRMMDEAEMEKYLEQRHHQRLIHEHQRESKHCKQEIKKQLEFSKTDECISAKYHEDVDEGLKALDYSSNKQFPLGACNILDTITTENKASHSSQERMKPMESRESSSSILTSPTSPSQWIENCSLKYREQEYLSTSASESDYTSDDGDATDVESGLDSDIEGDGNKRHVLARVTVTVDTPAESASDKDDKDSSGGGGGANALKNHGTE